MTTQPDDDPVIQPPPARLRRRIQVAAGALAFAGLVLVGWWWAAGTSIGPPVGPTLAGPAICERQVVVNFPRDADLAAHEQELRAHRRVTAVALETQQQVLEWYRSQFTKAGRPELAQLMRVDGMPADVWLATAPGDVDQVSAEIHAQLGSSAQAVWTTNPCASDRKRSSFAEPVTSTSR